MRNLLLAIGMVLAGLNIASAAGQETCPDMGNWVKVDNLSGFTYTHQVDKGYEVAESCYKAGTDVVYGDSNTVEAHDKHELSHASFFVQAVEVNTEPNPKEIEDVRIEEPVEEPQVLGESRALK